MVNQSESINELAAALAKAQAVMAGAKKDSNNPHFRSKYADLASVWEACREALTSNGLAVVQPTSVDGADVVVETRLIHASGQWIGSELRIRPSKADAQGIGSTITYARRYALAALVGVAPEDDDGNASVGLSERPSSRPEPQAPRQAPAEERAQRQPPVPPEAERVAKAVGGRVVPQDEAKAIQAREALLASLEAAERHGGQADLDACVKTIKALKLEEDTDVRARFKAAKAAVSSRAA